MLWGLRGWGGHNQALKGMRGFMEPEQILRGCEDLVQSRRAGITQLGADGRTLRALMEGFSGTLRGQGGFGGIPRAKGQGGFSA